MDAEKISQHIRDYLRGYGRHDLTALDRLANFGQWPEMAQREMLARAASIVRTFSDEELQAVADGAVSLQALAHEVAAELKGEGTR